MNWCISLHWKQLPRADRRRERLKRGGRAGDAGRKEWEAGEERGRMRGVVGRKPRGCAGSGREGLECA